MPRRREVPKRKWLPDPKYRNVLLTRFMNVVMQDGKKAIAEKIVYGALEIIEKEGMDPIDVFTKALENVKPNFEVKSRRVGGANFQIPMQVRPERKITLGMKWMITYARGRNERSMAQKLAAEIIAASKEEGAAVKKRTEVHRMAEANKAFSHFRF